MEASWLLVGAETLADGALGEGGFVDSKDQRGGLGPLRATAVSACAGWLSAFGMATSVTIALVMSVAPA